METNESTSTFMIITAAVYDLNGNYDTTDILVSGRTYYGMNKNIASEQGKTETKFLEYSYNDGKIFSYRNEYQEEIFVISERVLNNLESTIKPIISSKANVNDYVKTPYFPILHRTCF